MINKYWYRIMWYSECNDTENISEGYVFGCTFAEAMEHLTTMYGESEVSRIDIKWTDDTNCYVHEEKTEEDRRASDF